MEICNTNEFQPESLSGMKLADYKITRKQYDKFLNLVNLNVPENEIHKFITDNTTLLEFIMPNTGHHGTYYANKPQIQPPLANGKKGKIPDFLIAGKNSDGLQWFFVELKTPSAKLFNEAGDMLSTDANKGICQLLRYLHYANEKQGFIRDALEIPDFRSPKGLIVIGKEDEFYDNSKNDLKFYLNSVLKNVEIISYSRILREYEARLRSIR